MENIIAFVSRFFTVLSGFGFIGSIGAYERQIIDGTQAIIQGLIFIVLAFVFAAGAENLDEKGLKK